MLHLDLVGFQTQVSVELDDDFSCLDVVAHEFINPVCKVTNLWHELHLELLDGFDVSENIESGAQLLEL